MDPTRGETSIEREPLTLSTQQLQCAREAALFVLNTKTLEEAISIFTEGLQPVRGDPGRSGGEVVVKVHKKRQELNHVRAAAHERLPRQLLADVKDIVSAPF
ncbi:hypothetical protein Taro_025637 [Colocasia esculenta]|uniref:Uncharacterized protein n=1 Tax=Colocasia esculenta TaxID=4460 RepID=A0A843VEU3_COLES|nr:hypothetical protein [Colocasia esculenta]